MSDLMWWAQRGEYEAQMREEYERTPEAWEIEYEQWLDERDEEIYEQG